MHKSNAILFRERRVEEAIFRIRIPAVGALGPELEVEAGPGLVVHGDRVARDLDALGGGHGMEAERREEIFSECEGDWSDRRAFLISDLPWAAAAKSAKNRSRKGEEPSRGSPRSVTWRDT